MSKSPSTLGLWQGLSTKPGGKWAFSRLVCLKAPFFGSISPRFEAVEPAHCVVSMAKRRGVQNHIGTVHAIAMCNMAELAGGTMTEVTVPATHRWIPKGMSVEYLKKATTDLVATATPFSQPDWSKPAEYPVQVEVQDTAGATVFRAIITMWVTPPKPGA